MEFLNFHELKLYRQEIRDLVDEQNLFMSGIYVQQRKLGRIPSKEEVTTRLAEIAARLKYIADDIDARSFTTYGPGPIFKG
jgi:hypothetical protein